MHMVGDIFPNSGLIIFIPSCFFTQSRIYSSASCEASARRWAYVPGTYFIGLPSTFIVEPPLHSSSGAKAGPLPVIYHASLRKGADRLIVLPFRDITGDIGKTEVHAAFRTTDGRPGGNDGEGAIRALPEG
jgi:hypothetical protein